jgi:hypothetical protein
VIDTRHRYCSFFLLYKCVKKRWLKYIFIYFNITSLKPITINLNNKYNNNRLQFYGLFCLFNWLIIGVIKCGQSRIKPSCVLPVRRIFSSNF